MGMPQTGTCERCGGGLPLFQRTGLCGACRSKQAALSVLARPARLREHPDLDELDRKLNHWYS